MTVEVMPLRASWDWSKTCGEVVSTRELKNRESQITGAEVFKHDTN